MTYWNPVLRWGVDAFARDLAAAGGLGMITPDLMEAVRLADRILVMTGSPGRIVAEHRVDTPLAERDESWVFTRTAEFIRWPDIRTAFALPELP